MSSDKYRGIVRLKDGSKTVYDIDKAVGSVTEAQECLMSEVCNVQVALVVVPSEHDNGENCA